MAFDVMGLHGALFTRKLIHLADVERGVQALDGVGGRTETFNPHLYDVACRVQPLPIQQREIARLRMWFVVGVDIQEDDHVTNIRRAGDDEVLFGGNTYRVKFAGEPAGAGHHQIADLIELSGNE